MKKIKRIAALVLVFVLLSGMIGPDNIMALIAYAEDGQGESVPESQQLIEAEPTEAVEATEDEPAPGSAAPEILEETEVSFPDSQQPEEEGTADTGESAEPEEPSEAEASSAEAMSFEEAEAPAPDEGASAEEADAENDQGSAKEPADDGTADPCTEQKLGHIQLIPGLEMSLSGLLPAGAAVSFSETDYQPDETDRIILFKAKLHVCDETGREYQPERALTVEIKGEVIRSALTDAQTPGLIVNDRGAEAKLFKAQEDTVVFELKALDQFVLYQNNLLTAKNVELALGSASSETQTPSYRFPSAEVTLGEILSALQISLSEHNYNFRTDSGAVALSADKGKPDEIDSVTLTAKESFSDVTLTVVSTNGKDSHSILLSYAPPEPFRYVFADDDSYIMLLAFLREKGVETAGVDEAWIAEGDENVIELLDYIGDYMVTPRTHFDSLMISVLTHEGEQYAIELSFPQETEQSLTPALPGEAEMILTGTLPSGAAADVTPVAVEIGGAPALAAYDIDIHAPGVDNWQPGEGDAITVSVYDPAFAGKLYVYHMADASSTPEFVTETEAEGGWVSFRAASFSIYVISDHEQPFVIVNPRVEFHFINPYFGDGTTYGTSTVYYSSTPYRFINKAGLNQTTQILTDGESLEQIANPPNAADKYFYGWYVVDPFTADGGSGAVGSGSSVSALRYTWPGEPDQIPFETPITVSAAGSSAGDSLSWTLGGVNGSGIMDEEGVAHVLLAPVYRDYHFVNFMQRSREDTSGTGASNLMTRKLLVFGSAESVSIKISDIRSSSTDAVRRIFNGWEYSTDGGSTWIQINTVDYTGAEIEKSISVTGNVDLYPIFIEARWVDYDRGKSGNGSTYVPSRFLLAWENGVSMIEQEKVSILTDLGKSEMTGYTFSGWVIDPTSVDVDTGFPVGGTLITDSDGKVLDSVNYTKTNGSGEKAVTVQDGKLKFWKGLDTRLKLYARWTPNATTSFTVIVWKQKASDEWDAAQKTYDYESARTVTNVASGLTLAQVENSGRINSELNQSYTGFDSTPRLTMNTSTVASDGTTVVNVYYDREIHFFHYYVRSDRDYVEDSSKCITALYEHYIADQWPSQDNGDPTWRENSPTSTTRRSYWYEMAATDKNFYPFESDGTYVYNVYYFFENTDNTDFSVQPIAELYEGSNSLYYPGANISSFPGLALDRVVGSVKQTPADTAGSVRWQGASLDDTSYTGERFYAYRDTSTGYNDDYHRRFDFYYARRTYNLDFYVNYPDTAGITWEDIGGESNKSTDKLGTKVKFGASLSSYGEGGANWFEPKAPDHYEFTGWYEDPTCKVPFDFNGTMDASNQPLYAGWKAVQYIVRIDPNGGVIDHRSTGSQSTYFWGNYGTPIGQYYIDPPYVEIQEADHYTGNVYYYLNTQYIGGIHDGDWGLHADLRNAVYLTEAQLADYYSYYLSVTAANSGYYTGITPYASLDAFKDAYVHKENGAFVRYRPCETGSETYTFMGWYQVFSDGSIASAPYNFNDPVTGEVTLRAQWRLEGGIYVQYDPAFYYYDTANSRYVTINGNISQWTDPNDISQRLYSDQSPTTILQQPTGLTADGASTEDYIFRGWRVVQQDGTISVNGTNVVNWVPMETEVYYDPGDPFMIRNSLVTNTNAQGKIIYMQAYYEPTDASYRRPDVTNLVLDANTAYGGTIAPGKTTADLPLPAGPGRMAIQGDTIVYGDIQSNVTLHLYKYATEETYNGVTGQQFFANSGKYLLLGFDPVSNPDNIVEVDKQTGAATGAAQPYIPNYASDAVIGVRRDNVSTLYAIWEPMVYVTFVNTTGADIEIQVTGSGASTVSIVNQVTGTFDREQVVSSITVPARSGSKNGEVKIVLPKAVPGTDTITATARNDHGGYLLSVAGAFQSTDPYGTGSSGAAYHATADYTGTLQTDPDGVIVTYTEEKSPEYYFDVNGGTWQESSAEYTHVSGDVYSSTKEIPYKPADPTHSSYVFVGWTLNEDIKDHHDFYGTGSVTWGATTITPESGSNVLAKIRSDYLWDFSAAPPYGQTLYAVWSEKVTVTFDVSYNNSSNHTWTDTSGKYSGNTGTDTRNHTITIAKGDTVTKPTDPTTARITNASFLYWIVNPSNRNTPYTSYRGSAYLPTAINSNYIYDFSAYVLENTTLTTSWTRAKSYDVTVTKLLATDGFSELLTDEEFEFRYRICTYYYNSSGTPIRTTVSEPSSWQSLIVKPGAANAESITLHYWATNGQFYYETLELYEEDSTDWTLDSTNSTSTFVKSGYSERITAANKAKVVKIESNIFKVDLFTGIITSYSSGWRWQYGSGNNYNTFTSSNTWGYSSDDNPGDYHIAAVFTNSRKTVDITVKKTVSGTGADMTKSFSFTAALSYNGHPVSYGAFTGTDGTQSFELRDNGRYGDQKVLTVPIGAALAIQETGAEGYVTTVAGGSLGGSFDESSKTYSLTASAEGDLSFTNRLDISAPTAYTGSKNDGRFLTLLIISGLITLLGLMPCVRKRFAGRPFGSPAALETDARGEARAGPSEARSGAPPDRQEEQRLPTYCLYHGGCDGAAIRQSEERKKYAFERSNNMKNWKKLGALVLALALVLTLSVAAFAEDGNNTYKGDSKTTTSGNNIPIVKTIVMFNANGSDVYAPTITYNYTVTTVTGLTGVTVNDGTNSATVNDGVPGGVSGTSIAFAPGTDTVASAANGKELEKSGNLTVTINASTFQHAGIYRYKIEESIEGTGTDNENLQAVGMEARTGDYDTVRYLDVYIKNGTTGLELQGAVIFKTQETTSGNEGKDPITTTFDKTGGYEPGTEPGTGTANYTDDHTVDRYTTYDFEVAKAITGNLADKTHNFPFYVNITNTISGAKFTYTDDAGNASAETISGTSIAKGTEAKTSALKLKDGESIKFVGVPSNQTSALSISVKEWNDTVDQYTATVAVANGTAPTVTNGTMTANSDTPAVIGTFDIKANDAVNQKMTVTNNLSDISPTGVVIRFAPFVLLLGASLFMVLFARTRKSKKARG